AFAWEHFNTQNGRFAQALLVGLSYTLLGWQSVVVVPMLLLILLVVVLAWNLRIIMPFTRHSWISSLALSGSLVAVSLIAMPSFFDVYLWLTSCTVHLGSILM